MAVFLVTPEGSTIRQVFRIVHCPIDGGALRWPEVVIRGPHPAIVAWTPRGRRRRS